MKVAINWSPPTNMIPCPFARKTFGLRSEGESLRRRWGAALLLPALFVDEEPRPEALKIRGLRGADRESRARSRRFGPSLRSEGRLLREPKTKLLDLLWRGSELVAILGLGRFGVQGLIKTLKAYGPVGIRCWVFASQENAEAEPRYLAPATCEASRNRPRASRSLVRSGPSRENSDVPKNL